jgi:hypothetical protein
MNRGYATPLIDAAEEARLKEEEAKERQQKLAEEGKKIYDEEQKKKKEKKDEKKKREKDKDEEDKGKKNEEEGGGKEKDGKDETLVCFQCLSVDLYLGELLYSILIYHVQNKAAPAEVSKPEGPKFYKLNEYVLANMQNFLVASSLMLIDIAVQRSNSASRSCGKQRSTNAMQSLPN